MWSELCKCRSPHKDPPTNNIAITFAADISGSQRMTVKDAVCCWTYSQIKERRRSNRVNNGLMYVSGSQRAGAGWLIKETLNETVI